MLDTQDVIHQTFNTYQPVMQIIGTAESNISADLNDLIDIDVYIAHIVGYDCFYHCALLLFNSYK
jgi:hypothetical protein